VVLPRPSQAETRGAEEISVRGRSLSGGRFARPYRLSPVRPSGWTRQDSNLRSDSDFGERSSLPATASSGYEAERAIIAPRVPGTTMDDGHPVMWEPLSMDNSWSWKAVFRPRPRQFGLRGDECAWDAIAGVMPSCRPPADPDEAIAMIVDVFTRITGVALSVPAPEEGIGVPMFRTEGMSGGRVSPQWWNERFLPLLQKRVEQQFRLISK